jgi:hypothetical protein
MNQPVFGVPIGAWVLSIVVGLATNGIWQGMGYATRRVYKPRKGQDKDVTGSVGSAVSDTLRLLLLKQLRAVILSVPLFLIAAACTLLLTALLFHWWQL